MSDPSPSPTRCRASWKPRVDERDLPFVEAGDLTVIPLAGPAGACYSETGRAPLAELPYQRIDNAEAALAGHCAPLLDVAELPDDISVSYAIVGGYDANAVQVFWSTPGNAATTVPVRWVALKTFTGFQVKYPLPGKRPPLTFALADEDAYSYCDEPQCRECTFRCKQGFVIYVAFEGIGIVRMPLSPNRG